MSRRALILYLTAGLFLCLLTPIIGIAGGAKPSGSGPFLVLSLPYTGSAPEVIANAGGEQFGPLYTQRAAFSFGVPADTLIQSGAFAVLSASSLSFLCTTETSE